jgi:D-alanine--poly(phosphoribitol) ligase subunit 1
LLSNRSNMELLKGILSNFKRSPEKTAFKIAGKTYSYKDLEKRVSGILSALRDISPTEKIIGVWSCDDIDTYCCILAILYSGRGFMPVNPLSPGDRNSLIMLRSGIKTLLSPITEENLSGIFPVNNLKILSTRDIKDSEQTISVPPPAPGDIAYLLFTSGSTGIPKGVPITRGNLDSFIAAFFEAGYLLNEHDRCLQMFDLTFDFSIAAYFTPLYKGASVYTVPHKGIRYNHILNLLIEEKLTVAPMVPSILNHLRPFFYELKLNDLKYCYFCGEALTENTLKDFAVCAPNAKIVNFYGPTEATVFSLAYEWIPGSPANKSFNGVVSIGKPIGRIQPIVLDENGRPIPPNQKGELGLAGAQVTPGYWNDEDRNKSSFLSIQVNGIKNRFYRTGDMVLADSEGDFMFIGRFDHQVQVQGFRVELGEIEHFTRQFTGISNVAAVSCESEINNHRIHLFIENWPEHTDNIKNFLKSKLPYYMIPAGITTLKKLPLNENGKIDRIKLAQMIQGENRP